VNNEKMSKSLGNFFTVRDVLKVYDAEVVRFFILRAHYRSPLNYSDHNLDDARQSLTRLYTALSAVQQDILPIEKIDWETNPFANTFRRAMDDDFATPQAVAVLFDLAGEINKNPSVEKIALLKALGAQLGILQRNPEQFLKGDRDQLDMTEADIDAMLAERQEAKALKDFAKADQIRQNLMDHGIVIEDTADGAKWRKA
jgi:cysteinyl-tRNA synthetase